mmetsp:Transcript_20930/g.52579  ORF Transcript_20930/g.52579 Transcript_20930/m.52579 type:complete len:317 (+) Transcript_20930:2091-3041(+)
MLPGVVVNASWYGTAKHVKMRRIMMKMSQHCFPVLSGSKGNLNWYHFMSPACRSMIMAQSATNSSKSRAWLDPAGSSPPACDWGVGGTGPPLPPDWLPLATEERTLCPPAPCWEFVPVSTLLNIEFFENCPILIVTIMLLNSSESSMSSLFPSTLRSRFPTSTSSTSSKGSSGTSALSVGTSASRLLNTPGCPPPPPLGSARDDDALISGRILRVEVLLCTCCTYWYLSIKFVHRWSSSSSLKLWGVMTLRRRKLVVVWSVGVRSRGWIRFPSTCETTFRPSPGDRTPKDLDLVIFCPTGVPAWSALRMDWALRIL